VKAIERRAEGQRMAHIIANVASVQAANKLLRDGVHIHGKKVSARKMKREPKRCMKCQKINVCHFAKECPSEIDVCGTCGLNHRTDACTKTEQAKFACANCNSKGHASWDRLCPVILKAADRAESSDPEATYKYFPTAEEPWTWEQKTNRSKTNPHWQQAGLGAVDLGKIVGPEAEWRRVEGQKQRRAHAMMNNTNPRVGNRDSGWEKKNAENQPQPQGEFDWYTNQMSPAPPPPQ
jgi:hypothetical protein